MQPLQLNCDMGESFGAWTMGMDEAVMPHVHSANIACGFHASDPSTMRRTVALAVQHGVRIGAHPAYPDLVGFGRRSMACSAQEVEDLLLYQVGALDGICRAEGASLSYVKPHGALYNDMMKQHALLTAVMRAVARFNPQLPLMLLARRDNSEADLLFEAFADRGYDPDGYLLPRNQPGAVHHDPERILAQALSFARGEPIIASDGSQLTLHADSLCVHGDNAESVAVVARIRAALDAL